MSSPPAVQYASRTDVGMRRAANQDSMAVRLCSEVEEWSRCGHLFVVADGMGGHAVGDLASRITVDTLPHAYFKLDAQSIEQRLRDSIQAANKAINDRGRENREFEGMGTTCSVLSLSERGAIVGHVGDSRVYRVRRDRIEQLTFDHSLQWEMIRMGRATAENVELFHPRNVITRCLGPDLGVQVDIEGPFSVQTGDQFLLCSDGLTNHVTDTEIGQILLSLPPSESSRLLINLANCRGGSDNCTVVVVAIDSYPPLPMTGADIAVVELPRTAQPVVRTSPSSGNAARLIVGAIAVLCLLSGVVLAILNKRLPASVLIAAAVFAWLLSHRLGRRARTESRSAGITPPPASLQATDPYMELPTVEPLPDDTDSARTTFLAKSPYRIIAARVTQKLVSHLAEVQSELVQAARDSGWKVDFDELTHLHRQAVAAEQGQKSDRAVKCRAKAIDLLMRELYHRSRTT